MTRDNWVRSLGLDADGTPVCRDRQRDPAIRLLPATASAWRSHNSAARPHAAREPAAVLPVSHDTERDRRPSSSTPSHRRIPPVQKGICCSGCRRTNGTFAAKISGALGEEGRIIALEPEPRNFACLRKNIEANGLRNVVAIQKALWSRTQRLICIFPETPPLTGQQDAFAVPLNIPSA